MENQPLPSEQKTNSLFGDSNILEYYINQTARALIALIFTVILLWLLGLFFNLSFAWNLGIAILTGLMISPLLSKVRVGKIFVKKYTAFLDKQVERWAK
jgi:hypothetical protein